MNNLLLPVLRAVWHDFITSFCPFQSVIAWLVIAGSACQSLLLHCFNIMSDVNRVLLQFQRRWLAKPMNYLTSAIEVMTGLSRQGPNESIGATGTSLPRKCPWQPQSIQGLGPH